jgi:Rhs element Vgr protein
VTATSTIPTAATPDVCTFAIRLDGEALPGQYHVVFVSVARELNRIPCATIHVKDGEAAKQTFPASDTELFVPGTKVEIDLGYRSKNETVFRGVIVRHGLRARRSGAVLVLECKDEAVKLTQDVRSAYFVDQKDSEILEGILEGSGLKADVDPTGYDAGAVVQFDSTDWDFLLCRAEAHGRVVNVIDGQVSIKAPNAAQEAALSVAYGSTLLELDVEMDARLQDEGLAARAWNAADQAYIRSDASEPDVTGNGDIDAASLAEALGNGTESVAHGGALGEAELQAWADARLMKQRFARVRGRARFQGFAGLVPGDTLQVDGIGRRFAGKLFVSGVRHTVSHGNWETDAQLGLAPDLFARTFQVSHLPAAGLLPAVHGLQIGIVTALAGDPEGEQRIRVRLPHVSATDDGVWARLATLDAGAERGTYFRPEIDDECVVGFLHGDPRHAVVLGQLHSSAKATPEPLADDNHRKGYTSREKLRLVFDDEKKVVLLETPQGNSLSLSEEDRGITLQDQSGNRIVLSPDGIVIESVKDLTLKASANLTAKGVNVELAANAGFKASGNGTAELKSASTTVEGSAMLTLSGGLVKIN